MQPEKRTVILISVGVVIAIPYNHRGGAANEGAAAGTANMRSTTPRRWSIISTATLKTPPLPQRRPWRRSPRRRPSFSPAATCSRETALAIYVLESWLKTNSGSDAEALLEEYKNEPEDDESLSIGGQSVSEETETLSLSGVALTSADTKRSPTHEPHGSHAQRLRPERHIRCLLLTKLRSLSLNDNNITDLSPLSGLKELRTLYLSETRQAALSRCTPSAP